MLVDHSNQRNAKLPFQVCGFDCHLFRNKMYFFLESPVFVAKPTTQEVKQSRSVSPAPGQLARGVGTFATAARSTVRRGMKRVLPSIPTRKQSTVPLIRGVHAREVLDSRGQPTVEVEIACDYGPPVVSAIVPAGAEHGARPRLTNCAINDPQRYYGRGDLQAVANVNGTNRPSGPRV